VEHFKPELADTFKSRMYLLPTPMCGLESLFHQRAQRPGSQ